MTNLEQTLKAPFLGRIRNLLVAGIAFYSLAGILSSCENEIKPPEACLDECDYPGQIRKSAGLWKICQDNDFNNCLGWGTLNLNEQKTIYLFCQAADPDYCEADDDCLCSFERQFKGNKDYADKCLGKAYGVNPNFCSGNELEMTGPGEGMVCTNNLCNWGQKYKCVDKDKDGYYANQECWNTGLSDCDDNNPKVNADNGC